MVMSRNIESMSTTSERTRLKFSISLVSVKSAIDDGKTVAAIREIGEANWPSGNEVTLTTHLEACESLVIMKDGERIIGYSFIGHSKESDELGEIHLMYIGQLAIHPSHHRTNAAYILRAYIVSYAQDWEESNDKKLVTWFLTVNPIVYYYSAEIFIDLCPRPDGTFGDDSARVASMVRRSKGWTQDQVSPFTLKDLIAARYSNEESSRLDRITKQYSFDLFDKLGIDRSAGDRLMIVCKIPQRNKRAVLAKL